MCQNSRPTLTRNNFDKDGPIFKCYSLLNSERIRVLKMELKLRPPQICCWTILWKASGQMYSSSDQSDEKGIITVNVYEECYFFVLLCRLISIICLKCPLSKHMRALSPECHWSMDVLIVRCSMLCRTFRYNLKGWAMQQTKYCINVIMTSVSGKIKTCPYLWHFQTPP